MASGSTRKDAIVDPLRIRVELGGPLQRGWHCQKVDFISAHTASRSSSHFPFAPVLHRVRFPSALPQKAEPTPPDTQVVFHHGDL